MLLRLQVSSHLFIVQWLGCAHPAKIELLLCCTRMLWGSLPGCFRDGLAFYLERSCLNSAGQDNRLESDEVRMIVDPEKRKRDAPDSEITNMNQWGRTAVVYRAYFFRDWAMAAMGSWLRRSLNAEIANGRLAMVAIFWMWIQALYMQTESKQS